MPINTDDWSYRYQEMKAKLETEVRLALDASEMWRQHYIDLCSAQSKQNTLLLEQYALEGDVTVRDIIVRQEAARLDMQARWHNLRTQLDDYDQLNAAFEDVRMERDTLIRLNQGLEEDVSQLAEQLGDLNDPIGDL